MELHALPELVPLAVKVTVCVRVGVLRGEAVAEDVDDAAAEPVPPQRILNVRVAHALAEADALPLEDTEPEADGEAEGERDATERVDVTDGVRVSEAQQEVAS